MEIHTLQHMRVFTWREKVESTFESIRRRTVNNKQHNYIRENALDDKPRFYTTGSFCVTIVLHSVGQSWRLMDVEQHWVSYEFNEVF